VKGALKNFLCPKCGLFNFEQEYHMEDGSVVFVAIHEDGERYVLGQDAM